MFEWKAEEMKLHNGKYKTIVYSTYGCGNREEVTCYNVEDELSIEEKVKLLDEYSDGKFSYFVNMNKEYIANMNKEYKKELNNSVIEHSNYGRVLENSRKSWIRRKDTRLVFWDKDNVHTKDYLHLFFFSYSNNLYFGYEVNENKINNCFHDLMVYLEKKEIEWFKNHDEYEIKLKKLKDYHIRETFSNHIVHCSDGYIYVANDIGDIRKLSLQEINLLLDAHEKLDEYRNELAKITNISF